ncbi:hypothetical protein ACHZ98_29610 [Streptomyces sp. MAR4 CNY-716]
MSVLRAQARHGQLVVWLANVLSLTPPQVTVLRGTVEELQALTEVHWLYWLAAYGLLAFGSYVVLRWPERVARVGRRLRPARFAAVRLPVGAGADFVRRSLSGVNVGIMVCLLFLVVRRGTRWSRSGSSTPRVRRMRTGRSTGRSRRIRGLLRGWGR